MDIEVERFPAMQTGKPSSVYVKLIDDQGEVKGVVSIRPHFCRAGDPRGDKFWVEINTGNSLLDRPVDVKLLI